MKTSSSCQRSYELNFVTPLPSGYFLLEYTPDDGKGRIAFIDKTPLVGMASVLFENRLRWFPKTIRDIYIHDEDNPPTILFPCGGVQFKDVFLDSLEDYMQAMEYKYSWHEKG